MTYQKKKFTIFFIIRRCFYITKEYRINEEIRVKEARVIDANNNQIGILPVQEAMRLAEERNLDLVEIAPQAKPPVCRIMDYGKFKYEQSKHDKEIKKKQRVVDIKEIKLRPNIEEHDFQIKAKNAARFLKEGDKVKVTIVFRGREIVHTQLGQQVLKRLAEQVKEVSAVERLPKLEGKSMIMILAPVKQEEVKQA